MKAPDIRSGLVLIAIAALTVAGSWLTQAAPVPTPGVQAPGVQAPGIQVPGVQAPGIQVPGIQVPGVQAPGIQVPGIQAPGAASPPALGTVWVPGNAANGSQVGRSPDRDRDRDRDHGAWRITDEQWDKFKARAIASGLKLQVSVRLNTLRARNFKADLVELLSSIPGWEIDDQGTYTAGTLVSFDGILIQNASAVEPSTEAQAIMAAFEASGIQPAPVYEASEPGKVRIVIGAPPEDSRPRQ